MQTSFGSLRHFGAWADLRPGLGVPFCVDRLSRFYAEASAIPDAALSLAQAKQQTLKVGLLLYSWQRPRLHQRRLARQPVRSAGILRFHPEHRVAVDGGGP